MTEEEAKMKWCPWARCALGIRSNAGNKGFIVANRGSEVGEVSNNAFCMGSDCMAWRLHGGVSSTGVPNTASTNGYCGNAGKP